MGSFVHRTTRDLIIVTGPDAAAYLQGQLSQDVAGLAVGAAARSFVLAPQGKVDGWGRVHRTDDDRFVIDTDPGAGEAWLTRLRRFLLRTKADIEVRPAVGATAVRGSAVGDPPAGSLPAGWPAIDGWDVVGDTDAGSVPDDAIEIGAEAFEAHRIRSGVPRWGSEIGPDTIPATLGQWVIDASVSFTKGCYTGQELVARIDSRGGNVPRRLVGVRGDGAAMPVGSEVVVGEVSAPVTSSSADDDGAVALAFLPRSVEVPVQGWLRHGSAGAPPAQPPGGDGSGGAPPAQPPGGDGSVLLVELPMR